MRYKLLATAALALAAGTAFAQPPASHARHPGAGAFGLLEFDTNSDGRLTKAEFDTAQRARFDKIDANKDGTITREERQAARKAAAETHRAELNKVRFTELDKDKNGQLSQTEFSARGSDARDGKAGRRGGPGRHHAAFRGDGPKPGTDPEAGKVSFADFSARGAEAFTRADTNKDGTVTIAELQALKSSRP